MSSDLTPEAADQAAQKFRTFFQTLDDDERRVLAAMLKEQLSDDEVSGYLLPAQSYGFKLPSLDLFSPPQGPSPAEKAYPPMPLPMRPGT